MRRTCLVMLMLLLTPYAAHAQDALADKDALIAQLRSENAELRARVAELEQRIAQLEAQADDLTQETENLASEKRQLEKLAGVTTAGDVIAAQEARLITDYDAKSDRTTVTTQPTRLAIDAGSRADHYLSFAFSYPGESMDGPPQHVALFIQAVFSGGSYDRATPLTLTLNGETEMELTPADYDRVHKAIRAGSRSNKRLDNETLTYHLTPEQFERLARAARVTAKLGRVDFELDLEQRALAQAVQQRIALGR